VFNQLKAKASHVVVVDNVVLIINDVRVYSLQAGSVCNR